MPTTQQLIPESQTPNTLSTVAESTSVQKALSLMIEHDFSQLPVVDENFKLKGLITSDSILRASSYLKCEIAKITVSHAMLNTKGCRDDEDIATVLKILSESNSVPIVNKDGKLVGILTSYDTTEYYRQRAEDIMLAEVIEMTIREYIQSIYTDDELKIEVEGIGYSDDGKNKFKKVLKHYLSASNSLSVKFDQVVFDTAYKTHVETTKSAKEFEQLTLNEYIQMFSKVWIQNTNIFHDLEWKFMDKFLQDVRKIRNKIAHFHEVSLSERKKLEFCINLLDRYRSAIEKALDEKIEADSMVVVSDHIKASNRSDDSELTTPPYEIAESLHSRLSAIYNSYNQINLLGPALENLEFSAFSRNLIETICGFTTSSDEINENRYSPFASYLANQIDPETSKIRINFQKIEEIIQDQLPESAREHRNWWFNDPVGQPHSEQWLESGWRVSNVNMSEKEVTFVRIYGRQISYINFFARMIPKLSNNTDISIKPAVAAHGRHWSGVNITSSEVTESIWIALSFSRRSRFRIELYIDTGDQVKNKQIFDILNKQKNEIEQAFGSHLSWERLDEKRASRLAVYRENTSIESGSDELDKLENWITETLPKFYKSIALRFRDALKSVAE
jgi:predicted transcriptional regulator